mmetsp:Transcript_23197/g.53361  ORF Transcript_23197/g.53361 Transcript_23197/m.53361 type:complete len:260 (-) Transcript_23197:612-1391(-)
MDAKEPSVLWELLLQLTDIASILSRARCHLVEYSCSCFFSARYCPHAFSTCDRRPVTVLDVMLPKMLLALSDFSWMKAASFPLTSSTALCRLFSCLTSPMCVVQACSATRRHSSSSPACIRIITLNAALLWLSINAFSFSSSSATCKATCSSCFASWKCSFQVAKISTRRVPSASSACLVKASLVTLRPSVLHCINLSLATSTLCSYSAQISRSSRSLRACFSQDVNAFDRITAVLVVIDSKTFFVRSFCPAFVATSCS